MLHLWKVTGGETFWVIHPGPIPEMLQYLASEIGADLDEVEGDEVRLMGRNETVTVREDDDLPATTKTAREWCNETVTVREDDDLPATTKTAREWCNEATQPKILCAICY